MALLERGGKELRPTLTLEPCTNAWTLVVGLRCRRSSVSRFGGASVDIPAPAGITAHQPPVDPASHDMEGDGFGCSQEGYYPTSARCTPSFIGAYPCHVVVTHGALPSYRYPSRELVAHQRAVVTESYHPRGVAVRGFEGGLCLKPAPN